MKKTKKALSVFLALLMIMSIIPMSSITASATSRTPDEAIGWCQSELGHSLDYDGYYGAQCVDLIAFYYQWLGVTTPGGNGCDYAHNALPNGWTRVQGGQPQKGDILVYSGNSANPAGHVAIYESDYSQYHQNFNGHSYVEKITTIRYNGFSNPYWGYIRPNWGSGSSPSTSYFTSVWVDNVTETDATIHATITGTNLSTCGFYIGKSQSAMEKRTETVNGYVENIWYTLSSDYGTLQPSTTYYYKFFVTVGGTEYCSDVKTFKTSGNTYTISYNANGGTGAPASQTKAQGTTLIITETVPTRKGYTFLGWSTSSTATKATYTAGSHFTTDANTTLYAVWRADEYSGICGENVTWHLNVGTGVMTIFGNGAMDGYAYSDDQLWYDYREFIKTVVINEGVTKISRYAFASCQNITSITIPEGVITIDYGAFSECTSLTKITIPNSVTKIGDYAFFKCTSLTDVTISDSSVSIGNSTFYGCDNIKNISFGKNVTYIGDINISETSPYYNDKSNWKNGALYIDSYLIEVDKENIEGEFFVPDGTNIIAGSAFINCEKLTKVVIPEGVKSIGIQAFAQCPLLETVILPDNITIIETRMFYLCTSLTEIIIHNGVTKIKDWAFYGCKSLAEITIPNSVTKIDTDAFEYCSGLTDVYYIGTKQQWDMIDIDYTTNGNSNIDLKNATIHYCEERIEKQPTCEEDGYTAGLYCTECKEFVKDAQVIPATGHNYNSVATNPTCTEKGYTTYTCSCGYSFKSDYVNPLGHTYNSVITQPTCTETGYTTYTCACGDSYVTNETPAIGHSYRNGVCIKCGEAEATTPSEPDTPDEEFSINIQRPSRTTIRHNDGIILHANVEGELPENTSVVWYISNDNFDAGYLDDGMSCVFVSKNNGYTSIYAVIEDADGNELAVDSIELRSKAGFFDKIGGFFRSLFGSTKIYEN